MAPFDLRTLAGGVVLFAALAWIGYKWSELSQRMAIGGVLTVAGALFLAFGTGAVAALWPNATTAPDAVQISAIALIFAGAYLQLSAPNAEA